MERTVILPRSIKIRCRHCQAQFIHTVTQENLYKAVSCAACGSLDVENAPRDK